MSLWSPTDISFEKPKKVQIGPLGLWLLRRQWEWQVGQDRAPTIGPPDPAADAAAGPPPGLEWDRWAVDGDSLRLRLGPAMPDRPVVVRPEHDLSIAPSSTCTFYVSVALWVDVFVGPGHRETKLTSIPTLKLSNTWFGDPTEGELCYSVRTTARRALQDLAPQPHRVVCRVRMKNESDELLDLERFCLRMAHMGIYAGNSRLWANGCELSYQGGDRFSRVSYDASPPSEAGQTTVMTPPSVEPGDNVIHRSFGRLRDILQHRIF